MTQSNRTPAAQVEILRVECFHLSMFQNQGINHFELVDPAPGVLEQLQAWDPNTERHLEVQDRGTLHKFIFQRRGQIFNLKGSIRVDTTGDFSRILPRPATEDILGQFIAETDFSTIRPKGEPISRLAA